MTLLNGVRRSSSPSIHLQNRADFTMRSVTGALRRKSGYFTKAVFSGISNFRSDSTIIKTCRRYIKRKKRLQKVFF
jgi:hypothetical protein